MNKRSIINKMILLSSISACALLFSCGKSATETEDLNGKIIEFENIGGKTIDSNIPASKTYYSMSEYQALDKVLKYAYTSPTTDIETKESHEVKIKYGIGDVLYNHIKKYENEVELYNKNQEIKLSIFRMSYPSLNFYDIAKEIKEYPYYDRELYDRELYITKKPEGTKISEICQKDVIYTETNTLEYYFSESFKYDKLEFIDTITKDKLSALDSTDKAQYGILQYFFLLEPSNDSDEIIEFCRLANEEGSTKAPTKNGMEDITWQADNYVFPIANIDDPVFGKRQINHSALRMLPSSLNSGLTYVIEDNNVTFYTKKEVA